jgi:circularin A/uberolysin family circular bacteriocin
MLMSQKKNMLMVVAGLLVGSALLIFFENVPFLASQFGISSYAAKKIINIASGAGSVWAVIAVVGGSAGWGAVVLAAGKALLKKYGKAAAAAW